MNLSPPVIIKYPAVWALFSVKYLDLAESILQNI